MSKNTPGTNPVHPPLLCWDIFMESYWKKMQLGNDCRELNNLSRKNGWQHNWQFEEHLLKHDKTIVVTDTNLHIVFATINIFDMSGYLPAELVGKHPSVFQGEQTCPQAKARVRTAINAAEPFDVTLVNYQKNGLPYECHIEGFPVKDKDNNLVNFIAFENAVAS